MKEANKGSGGQRPTGRRAPNEAGCGSHVCSHKRTMAVRLGGGARPTTTTLAVLPFQR